MGEIVTITVPAIFVKGLLQDLLGGKSVTNANIRVILDADPDICGLYSLDKNHEQHYQDSIEFIGEPLTCSICRPKIWTGQPSMC